MSESKFKLIGVTNLMSFEVKLHDEIHNTVVDVPVFYNPLTDQIHVLTQLDDDLHATVLDAVRTFADQERSQPIDDAVSQSTWSDINVLTGLARPSITQEQ